MQEPLPDIQPTIRPYFEEFIAHDHVFDYYGLERGGHYAVLRWLLESGPWPYCAATGACSRRPAPMWGIRNGWHTSVRKPIAGALVYERDAVLSKLEASRIDHKRVIVCVRDVRNLMASRRKWHETRSNIFNVNIPGVETWVEYAKQVLGDEDYFDGKAVGVLYDKWFTDPAYRAGVLATINMKFGWDLREKDEGIEAVSRVGLGSSFDGTDYDRQASKMKVLERYKEYEDDEHINSLLTPEVLELNRRLINGVREG